MALIQLGVKLGNEVICQSFTFSASANPIKYVGGNPVFVDSESDTWNMCPEALERAIIDRIEITGKKPVAIIPVHLYGMPANMDAILSVAGRYGIPVLENAAEALGSRYKGRFCGSFGQFACLSFNGNKMITTSGGGALVCSSAEVAGRVKFLATQARDAAAHYQHSQVGYNYRLSNICAGIGRGQMLVLEEHVDRRREINGIYRSLLADMPGITFLANPSDNFESNHWLTSILVDPDVAGFNREELRLAMEAANIETRPLWKPMHLQPVFADCPFYTSSGNLPKNSYSNDVNSNLDNSICSRLFEHGLCLPSSPVLTQNDIERVVNVIIKLASRKLS